jgi:hypothetical protein
MRAERVTACVKKKAKAKAKKEYVKKGAHPAPAR